MPGDEVYWGGECVCASARVCVHPERDTKNQIAERGWGLQLFRALKNIFLGLLLTDLDQDMSNPLWPALQYCGASCCHPHKTLLSFPSV